MKFAVIPLEPPVPNRSHTYPSECPEIELRG